MRIRARNRAEPEAAPGSEAVRLHRPCPAALIAVRGPEFPTQTAAPGDLETRQERVE